MELARNCKNCGAVMEYSTQYYGKMYKCPYCKTEHHIDLLGRIEDYKVKFMWMGHLVEAYLTCYGMEPSTIDTSYIDMNGRMAIVSGPPTFNFEFIGHLVDESKGE